MTDPGDVVLEARGLSKSFPGVKALEDVGLKLRRGRLHALLGENGAGKSTLAGILAGAVAPDRGSLLLDGREVRFASPREARAAGIAMIHQELHLVPHLTAAENIFLGREPLNRLGLLDDAEMNRRAGELLRRLRLDVDPGAPVASLRVGQQQGVEIARALSGEARVLIMDEPTSALSEQEAERLFDLILDLKRQGVALAYITHKLEELRRIGDDATVLRDGRWMGSFEVDAASPDEIVRLMVGRDLQEPARKSPAPRGEEALRVEGLSLRHPDRPGDFAVKNVGFRVRRGEVLGLFGLMGAGRTELLETIFGLHPRSSSGTIWVDGRPTTLGSPLEAIRRGIVLAPEDRKREGLVLEMGVAANASLACLPEMERWGLLDGSREAERVSALIRRLNVRTPSLNQRVLHLSGGNQQKVVLAKWLLTGPRVLLLDEPTRGIDVHAKREIYGLIGELARDGLAVVFSSSELPEILAVCDRILVLCEGRATAEFDRAEADEESLLRAALPRRENGARRTA